MEVSTPDQSMESQCITSNDVLEGIRAQGKELTSLEQSQRPQVMNDCDTQHGTMSEEKKVTESCKTLRKKGRKAAAKAKPTGPPKKRGRPRKEPRAHDDEGPKMSIKGKKLKKKKKQI
eukprot:gene15526-21615_t